MLIINEKSVRVRVVATPTELEQQSKVIAPENHLLSGKTLTVVEFNSAKDMPTYENFSKVRLKNNKKKIWGILNKHLEHIK